ncbi:MAG TPA: hypothetical protein VH041_16980 [Caldimonas sp.]|jgi:hypothetical protein|nr:hypothetical protein [Caldimonas sp.]HEX4235983.1 hypothetical protein [Caldimonas sp.]
MRWFLFFATLMLASANARSQAGALYRCPSNEYTNMLSAAAADARQCTKIGKAEWVLAGSDHAGMQYQYNERRTVFRGNGLIETWLQVMPSAQEPDEGSDPLAPKEVMTVSPQRIECGRNTIASGNVYYFDPRDNTVVKDSRPRNPFFPPPEPVSAALIRDLCAAGRAR